MANLAIHKFRFPESITGGSENISYSSTAAELFSKIGNSEELLILCALSSKEDLLQIVSFFQQRKQHLKAVFPKIVLIDFQGGPKLLEAAQRLSFDKIISSKDYLADEEEIILKLSQEDSRSHHTYEDLFSSGEKLVLKKNTKRRIYPVEEESEINPRPELEVITETPVVTFKIYIDEKVIEASFSDYFDREIYLTTKTLPEDNHVTLEFKFSYLSKKKGLRLKAEVINIEEDNGEYLLTLKVESHLIEFETMLKIYHQREQNINAFMKKVKGH